MRTRIRQQSRRVSRDLYCSPDSSIHYIGAHLAHTLNPYNMDQQTTISKLKAAKDLRYITA